RLAWVWSEQQRRAVSRPDPSQPITLAAVHFGNAEIRLQAEPNYQPPSKVDSVVLLEVDDVDSFYRYTVHRGLKPAPGTAAYPSEPTDMPGGMRQVYVCDLDRHYLG